RIDRRPGFGRRLVGGAFGRRRFGRGRGGRGGRGLPGTLGRRRGRGRGAGGRRLDAGEHRTALDGALDVGDRQGRQDEADEGTDGRPWRQVVALRAPKAVIVEPPPKTERSAPLPC